MAALRPTTPNQDPAQPVDIGCGVQFPIRSSKLASLLRYTHDAERAPSRVQNKPFELDRLVITTRGHWLFHGHAGGIDVDHRSLMCGAAGTYYSCRHHRGCSDASLVLSLRPGALDLDFPPLFHKQIIPAQSALRSFQRAARTDTDEGFDSMVFALFDEASFASTGRSDIGSKFRMQRAKRFIELHAFERIGISDIAEELGLSPFTMLRQFRAATGLTPYAYVLQIRLERARKLLSATDDAIGSIAHAVGFDDLAYFSRWFSKSMRISPSAYRLCRR